MHYITKLFKLAPCEITLDVHTRQKHLLNFRVGRKASFNRIEAFFG